MFYVKTTNFDKKEMQKALILRLFCVILYTVGKKDKRGEKSLKVKNLSKIWKKKKELYLL